MLIYICGEYTCKGVDETRLWVADIAKQTNGIVFAVEHRYFGKSQIFPAGDDTFKTENFKYLTVENALQDLANFIYFIKKNPTLHNTDPKAPWLTVGGSYPGALSAWFRSKFPHLTVGALASSAVVNPILRFYEYEQQVRISAEKSGYKCFSTLQKLTQLMDKAINNDKKFEEIKVKLGVQSTDIKKWQVAQLMEAFFGSVQYGGRTKMCDDVLKFDTTDNEKLLEAGLNWIKANDYPPSYADSSLTYTKYDPNNLQNARQWVYQTCTQVGWFQISNPHRFLEMISQLVNIENTKKQCNDVFGKNIFGGDIWSEENINIFNHEHGQKNLAATHLIMTNGGEDPWQWASVTQSRNPGITALVSDCDNCAHCVDLYNQKDSDAPILKENRKITMDSFVQWINEYWAKESKKA